MKRKESSRRARPEPVLIKPVEGSSYAQVLYDLESEVQQDTSNVKMRDVRRTRNKDVLIEVGSDAGSRCRLTCAIKEVIRDVHELITRTYVEILDFDKTTEEAEVREALILRRKHSRYRESQHDEKFLQTEHERIRGAKRGVGREAAPYRTPQRMVLSCSVRKEMEVTVKCEGWTLNHGIMVLINCSPKVMGKRFWSCRLI